MKKSIFIAVLIAFFSCKNNTQNKDKEVSYISFGKQIDAENVISAQQMGEKYQNLQEGDTLNVKFTSVIEGVCKKKGCWINVPVGNKAKSFVKFKDYAFFMPMNSEGTNVIINGKAYINIIPVELLKHYAQDAGQSEEEIAKITEPKKVLAFMADGVLLEQSNEKK